MARLSAELGGRQEAVTVSGSGRTVNVPCFVISAVGIGSLKRGLELSDFKG